MPKASNTPKRKRSTFLYNTEAGTPLALFFKYLNGELSKAFTQREGKLRGIDAMSAFWLPYALRLDNKVDSLELKRTARSSVETLVRQIRAICEDFEIENPCDRADLRTDLNSLIEALAVRKEGEPVPFSQDDHERSLDLHSTHSASTYASAQEVIFVNDEDLLGDLA